MYCFTRVKTSHLICFVKFSQFKSFTHFLPYIDQQAIIDRKAILGASKVVWVTMTEYAVLWFRSIYLSIYLFFLAFLEFELKALHLPCRCSTTWALPPALFALASFQVESCDFCLELDSYLNPTSYGLLCSWDHSHITITGLFWIICWDGVSLFAWPRTAILLISASQVTGITDLSHHTWTSGLDLTWSLKACVFRVWSPACDAIVGGETFSRGS
jgi:hypothetical protein